MTRSHARGKRWTLQVFMHHRVQPCAAKLVMQPEFKTIDRCVQVHIVIGDAGNDESLNVSFHTRRVARKI